MDFTLPLAIFTFLCLAALLLIVSEGRPRPLRPRKRPYTLISPRAKRRG